MANVLAHALSMISRVLVGPFRKRRSVISNCVVEGRVEGIIVAGSGPGYASSEISGCIVYRKEA